MRRMAIAVALLVAIWLVCGGVSASAPGASFSGNLTKGNINLPISFSDSSIGSPTQWSWFFGDESYSQPWDVINIGTFNVRQAPASTVLPNGHIIVTGGLNGSTYYNDVWRSVDSGCTWSQINASSGWSARYGHSIVTLPDGSVILLGGRSAGNVFRNDTWRSTDEGATWTNVNASCGWSGRWSFAAYSTKNASTIIISAGQFSTAASSKLNDTWISYDNGLFWTLQNSSSGYQPRNYVGYTTTTGDKLILAGGSDDTSSVKNDTWQSSDYGLTWSQINASSGWSYRAAPSISTETDGSIILMGGTGTTTYSDAWRSQTGSSWTRINVSIGTPRYNHNAVTLPNGSVLILCGHTGSVQIGSVQSFSPSSSYNQNPSHIYTLPGKFTVTESAINSDGFNISSKTDYVEADPLIPDFTYNVSSGSGIAPITINFNDASNNATAWNWSFGDGTYSSLQDPSHSYANYGIFSVNLTINNNGAINTTSKNDIIKIYEQINADLSVNPQSGDIPLTVQFSDNSIGWNSGMYWKQLNSSAAFPPRYMHSVFNVDDQYLLLTGGTNSISGTTYNDSWKSYDGKIWEYIGESNYPARRGAASYYYNGYFWLSGGRNSTGGGNIQYNDTWRSTDGLHWTLINSSCGWTQRYEPMYWIFDNKMWLAFGVSASSSLNYPSDVWYSTDGNWWIDATGFTALGNRSGVPSAVSTDRIFTWGGAAMLPYNSTPYWLNDAYSSSDGITWIGGILKTQVAPGNWQSGTYLDQKIFSTGGEKYNEDQHNETWYTKDNTFWYIINRSSGFPARGIGTTIIFKNHSLIIGGANGSRSVVYNDVWETPDPAQQTWNWSFGDGTLSTLQNPSHTYTTSGTYTVSLNVSNGYSFNSTSQTFSTPVSIFYPSAAQILWFPGIVSWNATPTLADTCNWSFGDGSTSTSCNVSHQYTIPGSYPVALNVTNGSLYNINQTSVWLMI